MRIIALLLVAFVALSYVAFLILEMFYWNNPVGHQIFDTTPDSPRRRRCWPPIRASITVFSPPACYGGW